jgi:hypothetical protein
MEAGLLVLLGATVAPGLLASAFALVNERNGVSIPGELRSTAPMRSASSPGARSSAREDVLVPARRLGTGSDDCAESRAAHCRRPPLLPII